MLRNNGSDMLHYKLYVAVTATCRSISKKPQCKRRAKTQAASANTSDKPQKKKLQLPKKYRSGQNTSS